MVPRALRALFVTGLLSLILSPTTSRAEESHPGLAAESLYAEAVIAHNKKDFARSIVAVEELLKANPKHIEALQLLALNYKALGKTDGAYNTYRTLVTLSPESKRGPYYFELGTILHTRKQYAYAKPLFRRAISARFNIAPSHLFLGLEEFQDGQYPQAEDSFRVVARERDPDLSAIGYYYLGIIQLKLGNGGLGLGDLIEAKNAAERAPPESTSTHEMGKAAEKLVAPFDKGQWFASATVIPQFDSNVAISPVSGFGATGVYALKTNYTAGGGYLTSPIRLFQFVGSLRAAGNFNFLNATSSYNFHNFTGSVYLTHKPMGRFSFGIKGDTTMTFQCMTSDDGLGCTNRPFAIVGDPGLYLRWQPNGIFQVQWDLGARISHFFSSSDFSGLSPYTRAVFRVRTPTAFFNPGWTIGTEFNYAATDIWRYIAPSFELNNSIRLGASDTLVLSGTLSGYRYAWWSRIDGNIVLRVANVWNITPHWSLLADLSYTVNTSSESASYSYNRYTLGIGAGWSL